MGNIKAYIIEDERHNRDYLASLLLQHFSDTITVAGSAATVLEAAEFLHRQHADLLFLDIELADGQVFDLLNAIDYRKYKLIFVTGYSEHAIKAIKLSAVDYLLKPIIISEFIAAVNKACKTTASSNPLLDDLVSRRQFDLPAYLLINNLHSLEKIAIDQISHLEADGIYTIIYHQDKKTVSSKPLGTYEELLPTRIFHRCHKSFIVNKFYIKRVEKGRGLELTLHGGTLLPVSVRKKEEFRRWFME